MTAELRVDHGNLDMLHNHRTDVADRFSGVVGHNDIGSDLLAVVVNLPVQSDFEVDLSIAESESLAHK